MAKNEKAVAAENTPENTDSAENGETKKRNRAPSPFEPGAILSISVHTDLSDEENEETYLTVDPVELMRVVQAQFSDYATRITTRRREGAVDPIPSARLYIAPQGFEFPTETEKGVRVDSETANLIKSAMKNLGLDADDKESRDKFLKALLSKAAKAN